MSKLYDFKITGRTAASTDGTATGLIATKAVELHSDNTLKFTDVNGTLKTLQINEEVAELLSQILTGTGGAATAWLK